MKVSLQINLAPSDYQHAKYLLPHQLAILQHQVDEILLIVDTSPSQGRFGTGWHENKTNLYDFLTKEILSAYPVKIIPVDYGYDQQKQIGKFFFGRNRVPKKDFRGGPFYAYFFGLFKAQYPLVFHLDSDMFLGGGSQTWIKEAVELYQNNPDVLTLSPLPGPPHPEEKLVGQQNYKHIGHYQFEFKGMSTRIFLIDKDRLAKERLQLAKPRLKSQLKAMIEGNSNADLPEHLISNFMQRHQLKRIDFLGEGKGLWSLHPPFRNPQFYEQLPSLIRDVEENRLPAAQNGFYDVIDEVCDWEYNRQILKNNRWWQRLLG